MTERIVKLIRLRHTTEEFIASIVSEGDGVIEFYDPFELVHNQLTDGYALGIVPWSSAVDDPRFSVHESDILFVKEPRAAIRDTYLQNVKGNGKWFIEDCPSNRI